MMIDASRTGLQGCDRICVAPPSTLIGHSHQRETDKTDPPRKRVGEKRKMDPGPSQTPGPRSTCHQPVLRR